METIPKKNCHKIGYIQKQHGLDGELNLRIEAHFADSLEDIETIFLEHDGLLVPYFLEEDGIRFRSNESALVQLKWIDSEKRAKDLVGTAVFIHEKDFIRGEEEFTVNELVGFQLVDESKGIIGDILQVDDYAGNLLLTVVYNENEVMIPYSEDFVTAFDFDNKVIEMRCPDGIFDL
ncbi:MAG: ribosome maturation factor RimM [Mangrovibacterium sp.]